MKINSLDFLRAVYNNVELPLTVRMRAAGMAIPCEFPKLMAIAQVEANSFAATLERRRLHHKQMKLIEARPIEEGTPLAKEEGAKPNVIEPRKKKVVTNP